MKIKAFSFERNSFAFADIKRSVLDEFNDGGLYFESISDPNKLFSEIQKCLPTEDVIVIGVETSLYLKFKPILIKAFNFTPAYSDKIDSAIGDAISDEKVKKAHLLVPNESVELVSDSGLYSGFYLLSEGQYIVVFPLNNEVVPAVLKSSGLPFIKGEVKKEAEIEAVASPVSASEKAEKIVVKIAANGIKLSIPSTPAAALLKEDIKACEGYENCIFFTPFVNDDGAKDPKEYSAQLSRGAMELRSADMGATISNIFQEKSGDTVKSYYSFISVSTADKAVVRKLYADADETVENLISEATVELYSLIDKYADEVIFKKNATSDELEKYEQSLIEAEYKADARPVASISKKGAITAIAILGVAVVICIVLGYKFGGYFISSSDEPETVSLQNGTTTVPVTESTTLPVQTDTIIEYSSETTTTPFEVTANTVNIPILPNTIVTNNNSGYNNNRTTKKETTEKQTTEKQTTKKATTEPTAIQGEDM